MHHQVDFLTDSGYQGRNYDKVAGEFYANYGNFLVPTNRQIIYKLITDAREHGLESEVISTAQYIKELSPSRCLLEVFQQAYDEWIK